MFNKIHALKWLCAAICVSMIGVTVITSLKENLFEVFPRLIRDPWTLATFIDFYFNILIISVWMVYKENHVIRALAWFAGFVLLGSIATSFYVLVQLWKLKPEDPIEKVFMR